MTWLTTAQFVPLKPEKMSWPVLHVSSLSKVLVVTAFFPLSDLKCCLNFWQHLHYNNTSQPLVSLFCRSFLLSYHVFVPAINLGPNQVFCIFPRPWKLLWCFYLVTERLLCALSSIRGPSSVSQNAAARLSPISISLSIVCCTLHHTYPCLPPLGSPWVSIESECSLWSWVLPISKSIVYLLWFFITFELSCSCKAHDCKSCFVILLLYCFIISIRKSLTHFRN